MPYTKTELDMVRQKLSTEWEHDWEQTTERVKPHMTIIDEAEGDYFEVPYVGGTEMIEYTGSNVNMLLSNVNYEKRGMRYRKFYNYQNISIDQVDDMMNLEVTFNLKKEKQRAAAARKTDEIALGVIKDANTKKYRLKTEADGGYLGGILGTNYGGDGGLQKHNLDLTYPTASKRTNLVPVDYSITGTPGVSANFAGTIYDKINYIKRILSENEAFEGTSPGEICVAISPAEKQLLSAYEVGLNKDYGFGRLSETGATFNEHLNVTFVVTNMLPLMDTVNKAGTAVNGCTMCAAWLRSQVGYGVWRGAEWTLQNVTGVADVDHAIRVRGKAGAMRFRDDSVFILPMQRI